MLPGLQSNKNTHIAGGHAKWYTMEYRSAVYDTAKHCHSCDPAAKFLGIFPD